MPAGDGQISALISFICQAWWLAPSCEPGEDDVDALLGVVAAVDPALEATPAGTSVATSALLPVLSHLSLAKIWSWSIAVPTAGR